MSKSGSVAIDMAKRAAANQFQHYRQVMEKYESRAQPRVQDSKPKAEPSKPVNKTSK